MELARRAFCDLDLDAVPKRVVAAARPASSVQHAPLGVLDGSRRALKRFVTAGVDGMTRRRIDALPRGRGVLAELIANPVPLRVVELGAHHESRRAMDALDATTRIAPAVGGETDLEVILGPVAKPGRAVVSTRTPAIEREHDWSRTSR